MATNKVKVFFPEELKADPECINKFMTEHDVPANGIVVKDNFVLVNYFDKAYGVNSFDHVAVLSRDIAGEQNNILDWILDLRWSEQFTSDNDTRPEGDRIKPSNNEANVQVAQLTKRIEESKVKIAMRMKMIAELISGELVI